MKKVHADATQDGRGQNVPFATMSVRFRTATTMAIVLWANVNAVEDIQDNSANSVCIKHSLIRHQECLFEYCYLNLFYTVLTNIKAVNKCQLF